MIFFVKCLSQLILVVSGVISLLSEPFKKQNGRKRLNTPGKVLLIGILFGFVLFVVTEFLQGKAAQRAFEDEKTRYQTELQLFRSGLENDAIRELEIRWKASEQQLREIEQSFAKLNHPEASNWIKGGVIAKYDEDSRTWLFQILGVQERIESWSGSTKTKGFEGLTDVIDHTIIKELAIQRDDSLSSRLLDGATKISRLTIGRNNVITVRVSGKNLTYNVFEKGQVSFVCSEEYSYRKDYLPLNLTLKSNDSRISLDQTFTLKWEYPKIPTIEEEEQTVFKPPTQLPKSGPHALKSKFHWTDE